MSMANLFYRTPRLTVLALLFIGLIGSVAYVNLARQEDPTMTERFGGISTFLPGATAQRVESLISERIEKRLREIPEVKEIGSRSRTGYSLVNVELEDSVGPGQTDIVWSEVRDKLGEIEAELPAGATEPDLDVRGPVAATLIVALTWREGPPELSILSRLAEDLQIKLANLAGTKDVEIYGEAAEEILVAADPARLAGAGYSVGALAQRIRSADTKVAAGTLRSHRSDLLVEVNAELDSAERIARIPLSESASGQLMRVSDVAVVSKRALDPPQTMAFSGDTRAVMVSVVMEPNQHIGRWMAVARGTVDIFAESLPNAVALDVVYQQSDYTNGRLESLGFNLTYALLIVLVSLIWFMGARSALTVGIALPLSAAMVLGGLYFSGIPLHQMSVTGLIISLGLLIDNAIVVVEEYKLNRGRGRPIGDAIGLSVRHLAVPLAASTATTVFAFAPVPMTPGGTGEFTGSIAISVILSITSSFVLAMTVVPAIAGFIERRWPINRNRGYQWWHEGYRNARMLGIYRRTLRRILQRPALGLALGCVLPLVGFGLAGTLTQQFFPPVDRNQFQIQMALPEQTSIAETQRNVERARRILDEYPGVESSYWFLGEGAPPVYYNVMVNADGVASFASAWVNTVSPEATQQLLPELQSRLMREFPSAQVLALPFEQGPPFDAPIEVRIVGPELAELKRLGEELRLELAAVDGVTYTKSTLSSAEPKLALYPHEDHAALVGFSTGAIPERLSAVLHGTLAGTVQEGSSELAVRVRAHDQGRNDIGDLASMPLYSPRGALPLDQIADLHLEPSPSTIARFQGERINTVQGFLAPFAFPAPALAQFDQALAGSTFNLPAGYRIEFGGEAEQRNESVSKLMSTFAIFVVAMGAVVVLSLNSFRQAAIIALVGGLSIGLALFGVRLFGYPLGFTALIGTLGLVGLAINGAIIVLSALKADPIASSGNIDAAAEVVIESTRHIVSTTATTVGGFIPLILFGGTFWPPLATAIAGGVAGSAILALFTVPALYQVLARRNVAPSVDAPRPADVDVMPVPVRSVS